MGGLSLHFGSTILFNYVNDIPQAVGSELVLYADDTCLVFQHGDINKKEEHLNRDFQLWLIGL